MNTEEFTLAFTYLCKAYNKEVDKSQLKIWYDFLKEYPLGVFKKAIVQCINERKTFPSIAELKEIIIKQEDNQVGLKADEEWEKVLEVVRKYGRYQPEEALNNLQPITRSIVKRIGYQEICNADEDRKYNLRSAFLKSFESAKDEMIRYKKATDKDTIEMKLIQERNKNILTSGTNNLIRRISDVVDEEI